MSDYNNSTPAADATVVDLAAIRRANDEAAEAENPNAPHSVGWLLMQAVQSVSQGEDAVFDDVPPPSLEEAARAVVASPELASYFSVYDGPGYELRLLATTVAALGIITRWRAALAAVLAEGRLFGPS